LAGKKNTRRHVRKHLAVSIEPMNQTKSSILPVILCGGSGARLWLLSRQRWLLRYSINDRGDSQ
jgi:hypothetical protein